MTKRKTKAPKAKVTYRRFLPRFWNDRDIQGVLTLEQKAVLGYTFTNEHSHPVGVYRLKPSWVEDELEIPFSAFLELAHGPLAPFLTYDEETEEIFVYAMAEHQIDGGLHGQDKRIPWVEKQVASVRSDALRAAFWARYHDWNLDPERMDVPDTVSGVEKHPPEDGNPDPSIHGGNGARPRKTKGHPEGPSGRGIGKGLTPRPIAKPAAAAATAEGSRTSTATSPSPTPPPWEDGESIARTNGNGAHPPAEADRQTLIEAAEPIARCGLNRMRGRDDEGDVFVTPKGAAEPVRIGYGLDLKRWRDLAHQVESVEPETLARALWFAPDVLEMPAPITMALLEATPGALAQMIHRALEATSRAPTAPKLPPIGRPMPTAVDPDFEEKRAKAKALAAAALAARNGEL